MGLKTWLFIYKLYIALLLSCGDGSMFDFHLTDGNNSNSTIQEQRCKNLGYDGFAVLSTPEAYIYALKATAYVRNHLNKGTYIGVHYQSTSDVTVWDDGTSPRSDAPFYSIPPSADPSRPYGYLDPWGMLRMGQGMDSWPGLCGNHRNYPTESLGQTLTGELQTTDREVLSELRVYSYLECSILCGMLYECRAAEFDLDLFTCTLIGQYTSAGNSINPGVLTFIRESF